MHPRLVRKVLFPLHERLRGRDTLRHLTELEATQWASPETLQRLQLRKLRRLLEHAYAEVPYYRGVFEDIGVTPADIRSLSDLEALPLLDKDIIREQADALVAKGHRGRLLPNWTSGSSGSPVSFLVSKEKECLGNAAKLRARRWWGLDIGDRELHMWGNARELRNTSGVRRAKDRLLNLVVVSAYDLSEQGIERLLRILRRFRPRSVYGYPSAMATFARALLDRGEDVVSCGVKYVISTAESLLDADREVIGRAFGARVLVEYGAHDGCAVIAHDCPCGRMHTTDELVYLEFLRNGRPVPDGETGEIVLTVLDSFGMPFIRYRIGDLGRRGPTGCGLGRGLGSLEALEGRVSELLYTAEGVPVPALFLTNSLKRAPGIADFQVEQHTLRRFTVRIVRGAGYGPGSEAWVDRVLRERFGPVDLRFEYVQRIPAGPSGKKQWVRCWVGRERASGPGP